MKAILLALTLTLFLFATAADAQNFVKVPIIGCGSYPIIVGQEKTTGPCRPDLSVLPEKVLIWNGMRTTNKKEYMVQMANDFSKYTPGKDWSVPGPAEIALELKANGLSNKPPEPPGQSSWILEKLWQWIGPSLAWALGTSDNFNRGYNVYPLDGSWVNGCIVSVDCPYYLQINSNQVWGVGGIFFTYATTNAYTSAADQEAQITVGFNASACTASPNNCFAGLVLRNDGAGSMYVAHTDGGSTYTDITVFQPSGSETVAQNLTTQWNATGDVMKFRVEGQTVTAYRNGVSWMTTAVPSPLQITTGQPGMIIGNGLSSSDVQMDDFSSTDVAAAGVSARRREVRY